MNDPAQILIELAHGHVAARCLQIVAELGVADVLGARAASAEELAAQTGVSADALGRILRLLAAHGVFAAEGGAYVHTAASRLLRGDAPGSLRSLVRMNGMPVIWNQYTELAHAVRTGRPATDWAGLLEYFAAHAEEAAQFNQAMVGKSAAVVPAIVAAYEFDAFSTIADIGGGHGHLLEAVLESAPAASGVLYDLPQVIAEAAGRANDRLERRGGDFFVDALPRADLYLLMEVLHDWADADASRILGAIHRAAPPGAHVLIVESLVPETPGPARAKTLDIMMLALTGGRERTRAEYETLLGAGGYRLERVLPTTTAYSLVEAIKD